MIRIGVCASPERILDVERMGFDYIEGNLAALADMSEAEFESLVSLVDSATIKVETYNCLLPGRLKLTGPDVNAGALHEYFDTAFERAKRLGGQVVVFGSGGSRGVPEGWPMDVAWRQIVNFLRLVERHCVDHDITIAIEPLRRFECNIINMVSEAMALASIVQLPHIKVLGDTYHMAMGHEPLSNLTAAGSMLAHVHTANSIGRVFPKPDDGEDYRAIFAALEQGGYDGRVSIEGGANDFEEDAPIALSVLNEARKPV